MKNKLLSLYAVSLCNLIALDQHTLTREQEIRQKIKEEFSKRGYDGFVEYFRETDVTAFLKKHSKECTELQNVKTFTPEQFYSRMYDLKKIFEMKEVELLELFKIKSIELSSILEDILKLDTSSLPEKYYGDCSIQPMPENCLLAKKMAKAKEMTAISASIGRLRNQYKIDITEMIKSAPISLTNLTDFLLDKASKEAASSEIEVKK